ncbi:MAG: T9SS C-terminal target domain-containing protein [Bacteroidales bacterium]|nr:MAG: T9SS C-terminal target domain-containing protein [Bacteroidales bacterium]
MNKYLSTILSVIVLGMSLASSAQNFTVTSPSTDPFKKLCKPIKAGGSFQMQIKVKSNINETLTISIDKDLSFSTWADWFTIDVNSYAIVKDQTVVFLLTVNVPANTDENKYYFNPYFNARKGTTNSPFQGGDFNIIVDNTPPQTPSVNISSKTSSSIAINFNSYDDRSVEYTNANAGAGVNGIKSYTLVLKNPDGTPKETKSADAKDISTSYTFSNLAGYTEYTATVTATDVATNSKTSPGLATRTKVSAPTNLTAASISYCSATLTWASTPGATRYIVSRSENGENPTYTSSTSLPVSGLAANTSYTYYISAEGAEGESPRSKLIIKTLTIPSPSISGPTAVCTSSATYTVTNLPSGCTVLWGQSSNLSLLSASGNSATFISNGDNGYGWVKATFDSGCGTAFNSSSVTTGLLIPEPITVAFDFPPGRITAYIDGVPNATAYKWYLDGALKFNNTPNTKVVFRRYQNDYDHVYYIDVAAVNACGVSYIRRAEVSAPSGSGYNAFTIYPNPATENITLAISRGENTASTSLTGTATQTAKFISTSAYTIRILDSSGMLKASVKKSGETATILVSNLRNGIYIVEINDGKNVYQQQLVIKR